MTGRLPARSPARPRRSPQRVTCSSASVGDNASTRYCHCNITADIQAAVMQRRVTRAVAERVADGLGQRDRAILESIGGCRVLTGGQVERVHFAGLQGRHRDRTRRRVLERLVELKLLTALQRRIGGVRAGSAGLVFALGPLGQRLQTLSAAGGARGSARPGRVRRPGTPTERFLEHNLAVSELYVRLVEQARGGRFELVEFRAEPACWWRNSEGKWIRPDAYVVIRAGEAAGDSWEDCWTVEVDRATESVPTLRRQLVTYLDLVANGERGPDGDDVLPRVLVTVPDEERLQDVRELLRGLPAVASQLISVVLEGEAVRHLVRVLRE
jgi:hypothetical protein